MKSSNCALLSLILALIVGGAYYFYTQKDKDDSNKPLTSQESISGGSAPEENNVSLIEPEKVNLSDVSGGEGSAIANRIFASKQFIHTITAQLPTQSSGKYYSGWLAKPNGTIVDYINTGKFEQTGDGFYLEFRSDIDYSDFKKVIVSLQSAETVQPEKVILEGEFK